MEPNLLGLIPASNQRALTRSRLVEATAELSIMKTSRLIFLFLAQILVLELHVRAQIYLSDYYLSNSGNVGAYTLSGQPINPTLFPAPIAEGLTVDGGFIYVAQGNGTIGKYTTSGAVINSSLVSGLGWPWGIAISGTNLYVADLTKNQIGVYTTSGQTVNSSLITGFSGWYLAVNKDYLFVDNGTNIAKYTLDGSLVNPSLISGPARFGAMDISGDRLFVASAANGTIGEYLLDGTPVNASLVTGLQALSGISIAGGHLFVSNEQPSTSTRRISEYNLDGSIANISLISGLIGTNIDVLVPEPAPWALATLALGAALVKHRRAHRIVSQTDPSARRVPRSPWNWVRVQHRR
jgi:hypothetical protein